MGNTNSKDKYCFLSKPVNEIIGRFLSKESFINGFFTIWLYFCLYIKQGTLFIGIFPFIYSANAIGVLELLDTEIESK